MVVVVVVVRMCDREKQAFAYSVAIDQSIGKKEKKEKRWRAGRERRKYKADGYLLQHCVYSFVHSFIHSVKPGWEEDM